MPLQYRNMRSKSVIHNMTLSLWLYPYVIITTVDGNDDGSGGGSMEASTWRHVVDADVAPGGSC